MTPEDKARIEEIREVANSSGADYMTEAKGDVLFLLAQLDETSSRLASAHAALRGIIEIGKRDLTNPKYDGYFQTARKALDGSTDPDTGTKGSLGEE